MRLIADLHVHSVASGHAYSTVNEIARAAAGKGLQLVAITDHGPAMPGGPHAYHFGNLHVLPPRIQGVEVLRGIEANIIDHQGNIDLPSHYCHKLDIILAGLHAVCYPGGTAKQNTWALVKAMENPCIDAIVHSGNPAFPLDEREIVQAAVETDTLLEINNSSLTVTRAGSCENCKKIARLAAEKGAKIVISSDAHTSWEVGNFTRSLQLVKEAGIQEEQVLNTSRRKVYAFFKQKGRKRFQAWDDV